MAHNCIKYRLTEQGTVPDFLYLGEDGVGGVYAVADPSTPSPRDMVMIGISNDNATGDFEVVATKNDLITYLTDVGSSWQMPGPTPDEMIPFDPAAASDWVWNRLDALNT